MITTDHDAGVAVITINNPPVNALNTTVVDQLDKAIQTIHSSDDVQAVVLIGAGATFVAGADIKELESMAWGLGPGAPNLHELLLKIEDCAKPIVMAIHGSALGGGLELAMAGHYRIALNSAKFGQPEVNLGIIPGAEGTQRLPRLVGVEKAVEMCVSGKLVSASEAQQAGLIDCVIESELRSQAVAFASRMASSGALPRKTRERAVELRSAESLSAALQAGEELARKIRRNQIAPLKVLQAIRAAATEHFSAGCSAERQLFQECVTSDQCRALIHAFFAERAVSKTPGLGSPKDVSSINSVFIVGAGTMGRGIAMACANAGMSVGLLDSNQESLAAAVSAIRKTYDASVKRRRFTQEAVTERLNRIRCETDYAAAATADLVIEAVFEDLDLKRSVFREIDRVAKPNCILASNTSTLDIDELAAQARIPDRVVGLHFFSPANVMRLLEIVRGRLTSPATLASAMGFAKRLSKVGVPVGNGPGFVGNRLMFPYMYEAQFMVEEGATPEQVDHALRSFGMAMGIFEVDDMAGLDVAWRVRRELRQFAAPDQRKPIAAEALCKMGRFGQKVGRGWYVYGEDGKPASDPEVLELVRRLSREAGIPQRKFSDEEIIERCLYALINEGARVLEQGLVFRASDIDVIYLNGYGFPSWRGGPMFYADSIGLKHIANRILDFENDFGSRWSLAPMLNELAREGGTFRALDQQREREQ